MHGIEHHGNQQLGLPRQCAIAESQIPRPVDQVQEFWVKFLIYLQRLFWHDIILLSLNSDHLCFGNHSISPKWEARSFSLRLSVFTLAERIHYRTRSLPCHFFQYAFDLLTRRFFAWPEGCWSGP